MFSLGLKASAVAIVLAIAAGMYARHSYLITELEAERHRAEQLANAAKQSEQNLMRANARLERERELSELFIAGTERITHFIETERTVIREAEADCLDTDMPPEIVKILSGDK